MIDESTFVEIFCYILRLFEIEVYLLNFL